MQSVGESMDGRAVTNVRDLATFRRYFALLASRHGQILNKTDLAAPLGEDRSAPAAQSQVRAVA
jgi:hypothetical protein